MDWKFLLHDDRAKDIITESLRFMVRDGRVSVYCFVIMSNHLHILWQVQGNWSLAEVQRDFLRYTSQRILQLLRNDNSPLYNDLIIDSNDRKRSVWQKHSLARSLDSRRFLLQKVWYIHQNPVKAGLCRYPEDYKYSSAGFYLLGDKDWDFLTHYDG